MSQLTKESSEAIVKGMKRPMLIDGPELDKLRLDRAELLEALKDFMADWENKEMSDQMIVRRMQQRSAAAIRKAEEQA